MANLPPVNKLLMTAGGIGVVASLLAVITNVGVAQLLALPEGAELSEIGDATVADASEDQATNERPRSRRPASASSFTKPIIERNMFDPDAIGVTEASDDDDVDGRKTDLDIVLLATIVADYDPEARCQKSPYSSALIAEDERNRGRATGYGIGSDLMGEGEVICIDQKRIWIRRTNGDTEYLAVDESEKPPERSSSRSNDDDGDDRIQTDGDTTTVDRELVDEQMQNLEKLATQIRVVPHKGPDGEIDGYRLSAIRRGSLFDQLGIKNGDIVHAVNGMPLTSTDGALSAYQSLMSESSFSFDVTRRNQKKTFNYEIR